MCGGSIATGDRVEKAHTTEFTINGFVRFKGGGFSLAPSQTVLLGS
jgi:hypothetical protein